MCTVVLLRRPEAVWPLILGANRDEMVDRPWLAPGRHWPDRPDIVAGQDSLAGGTWLGLNDHGLVAAVLNRVGSLGPALDRRSRGELPLDALDHAEAGAAADALSHIDASAYRSFNLVVADSAEAFWLRGDGHARVDVATLPDGLSMLTAHDLNDANSPRIAHHRARLIAADPPNPETEDWTDWQACLGSTEVAPGAEPSSAMCLIHRGNGAGNGGSYIGDVDLPTATMPAGFGTVSSSLIALPDPTRQDLAPVWRFAPGPPHLTAYDDVEL